MAIQKPLQFYQEHNWNLYKEQKVVEFKPAVWQFKTGGIDLTNGGSYGLEFHDTGWKLIIHVKYDYKTDLYTFRSKYGEIFCVHDLGAEQLHYTSNWDLNDMTENIAKALKVPTNTNVVIKFHADCQPAAALKQWAQQFDKVVYPPTKSELQTAYQKELEKFTNVQFSNVKFGGSELYSPPNDYSQLSNLLPGVNERVKCPCTSIDNQGVCSWSGTLNTIKKTVIHLNDYHKWKREDIADWLDQLPDEIDITFKTPIEKESV